MRCCARRNARRALEVPTLLRSSLGAASPPPPGSAKRRAGGCGVPAATHARLSSSAPCDVRAGWPDRCLHKATALEYPVDDGDAAQIHLPRGYIRRNGSN
mmetsp:Transcript_1693/g.4505  ORF Transcript_1693/g.4505 Transcript_1693/m.4505 type:complete len:100 (-) Transcript_1693:1108-1407(-)